MEYDYIEVPAQLIRDMISLANAGFDVGDYVDELEAILEEQGK